MKWGKYMNVEKINYSGYDIEIIYQPFFDDSTAKSKQYQLIIRKDGKEHVNRYGLTRSSAITHYMRWIDKKTKISDRR